MARRKAAQSGFRLTAEEEVQPAVHPFYATINAVFGKQSFNRQVKTGPMTLGMEPTG
jgi:hypothetical protein